MCGIGGAVSIDEEFRGVLPLILNDQRMRGPDHAGMLHLNKDHLQISLAHNRLAILDLNADSNQPFVDVASGACIVYNGEIYNYVELRAELRALGEVFRTQSDTEVLLKAYLRWGTEAFARLNGMFAFAIWDAPKKRLVLARDRFGVKPCYYVHRDGRFAFASNTNALAAYLGLDIDRDYLSNGVLSGLFEVGRNASPYVDMQSLPPGHFLVLNGAPLRIEPFYDLRARVQAQSDELAGLDEDTVLKRLDETLRSAVELRLRSDVPVTLSLSGGLDSALLASYIKEIRPEAALEAFTFGSAQNHRHEAALAAESARHLGIHLNFAEILPQDLIGAFERTLEAQGAPFAHPSVIAQNRVFEAMRAQGFKVSLGGQGADEVFMGYRKFQFFNVEELALKHQWLKCLKALWGVTLMVRAEMTSLSPVWTYVKRYLHKPISHEVFAQHAMTGFDVRFASFRTLRERQLADMGDASLLTLLRYEDRNSMGSSVESRMPFLDYRIVEFGLALPNTRKINAGYGKWILRRLASSRLPKKIVFSRTKLAFALSMKCWLQDQGLGNHIYETVSRRLSRLEGLYGPEYLARLRERSTYLNPDHFALVVGAYWLATRG